MTESGWLIEFPSSPPAWWDGRGPDTGIFLAERAVRFSRREDAERVLAWLVKPKRPDAFVSEHMWPGPVATLEVREAPDLAKELTAWLDNNVMRCPHGTIGVTCHICTTEHLSRWLPR